MYLASPYSAKGRDPTSPEASRIRQERYETICKVAARMMESGMHIFCPIAHSHPIEQVGMADIKDGDWWLNQDYAILQHCDAMYVCMMPGWTDSYGIGKEIEFAQAKGIPVIYFSPEDKFNKANATDALYR